MDAAAAGPRRKAARDALLQILPADGSELSGGAILAQATGTWRSRTYTTLAELEREGLVSSRQQSWTSQRRVRLLYHLTEAGQIVRRTLNDDG